MVASKALLVARDFSHASDAAAEYASGLTERSGGSFPTARPWEVAADSSGQLRALGC
jgi:hypothetical protein